METAEFGKAESFHASISWFLTLLKKRQSASCEMETPFMMKFLSCEHFIHMPDELFTLFLYLQQHETSVPAGIKEYLQFA